MYNNIIRTKNVQDVEEVTRKHPEYFTHDFETWLKNDNNFCYKSEDNLGFGEMKEEGQYWVHLCLNSARGREAIDLTSRFVDRLYEDTKFNVAVGVIHHDNRKAKWLIRQIGFTSLGEVETDYGLCEMFFTTKKEQQ